MSHAWIFPFALRQAQGERKNPSLNGGEGGYVPASLLFGCLTLSRLSDIRAAFAIHDAELAVTEFASRPSQPLGDSP
jgi:hypothetical protein